MKKYVVFVAYSLKGNGYTEVPDRLKSTHKLFNTPEEAVAAILHDIEVEYHNDSDYKDFEITPPQIRTFADGTGLGTKSVGIAVLQCLTCQTSLDVGKLLSPSSRIAVYSGR